MGLCTGNAGFRNVVTGTPLQHFLARLPLHLSASFMPPRLPLSPRETFAGSRVTAVENSLQPRTASGFRCSQRGNRAALGLFSPNTISLVGISRAWVSDHFRRLEIKIKSKSAPAALPPPGTGPAATLPGGVPGRRLSH